MIIYTADYRCLLPSSKIHSIMTNETAGILKQHFVWVIKNLTNTFHPPFIFHCHLKVIIFALFAPGKVLSEI